MNNKLGIGSRIKHEVFGEGVICAVRYREYLASFPERGVEEIDKDSTDFTVIEQVNEAENIPVNEVEEIFTSLLEKYADMTELIPISDRWKNGTMILKPYDDSLTPKEIPISSFFHKIVMLRDRLRVMEQKINSNKKLSDEEKVDIQQYITRIYGSLTTFNILFKLKEDNFVGQKGDK